MAWITLKPSTSRQRTLHANAELNCRRPIITNRPTYTLADCTPTSSAAAATRHIRGVTTMVSAPPKPQPRTYCNAAVCESCARIGVSSLTVHDSRICATGTMQSVCLKAKLRSR